MGASALLVDEDVSAANFMSRDGRMVRFVLRICVFFFSIYYPFTPLKTCTSFFLEHLRLLL